MIKLTREDILHVAKLSNLNLSESEVEKFQLQLSKVVEYISDLSTLETNDIQPTSQTTGLKNVFRDDAITTDSAMTQDEAISGTDNTHNGYFKVGAILTERTDK